MPKVAVFPRFESALNRAPKRKMLGRVTQVVGLIIESFGPNSRLGDLCHLIDQRSGRTLATPAEVVGFRGDRTLLMPLGELTGVRPGTLVESTGTCLSVPIGSDLLGKVLDGLGQPMDGSLLAGTASYPVHALPPNPLQRTMICETLPTGVRAIDALLTLGIGQRVGIFAGSGVGKSTLLGMIARYCASDVNVIALVGERGREVREFIDNDLSADGLSKSVVVCATSDQPALVRIKAALTATAIAEAFRDQGKRVLLMMDSVTRFAMAQRELGLAVGEPPSSKGYTPSVFALLPKLMERAGNGSTGSITALYTVLVEGDDTNEPVADATRSILDGHIVLERKLTSKGHYPPIDVLRSLSRTMGFTSSPEHLEHARTFRALLAAREDIEDLVSLGAYKAGTQPVADRALAMRSVMDSFLRQDKEECSDIETTLQQLAEMVAEPTKQ